MSISVNQINLVGRLSGDPVARNLQDGTLVVSFSLAVDRARTKDGEPTADFFNCTIWRQPAEFVRDYAKKGRLVYVSGRLEARQYQTRNGEKGTSLEVNCSLVQMLETKSAVEAATNRAPSAATQWDNHQAAQVEEDDSDPFGDP